MKVFFFMDVFLLERFQKFSNWSQKTCGLTNFWWAKFIVKIILVLMSLDYIIDIVDGSEGLILFLDSVFMLYWSIISIKVAKFCSELDEKYANGHSYINERLIEWTGKRLVYFILALPFSLLGIMVSIITMDVFIAVRILPFSIALGLIIPCVYFLSCTPLPPGQSKMKV